MFDKLEKIENFINQVLSKLFTAIFVLYKKIIHNILPKSLFIWIDNRKLKNIEQKKQLIEYQLKKRLLLKQKFHQQKEVFFKKINTIQQYPVKEKGFEKYKELKEYLLETHPKVHFFTFKEFCKKSFIKIKETLKNYNNIYTKITFTSIFILFFGSSLIYFGGYEIYHGEFDGRAPASADTYDYRPNYHLYEPKTLQILNVKIPVWPENVSKIDAITIDFALKTTTRFARHYLLEYEYKLRDHFFTNVEPVISNFPLENEGQEILKDKIKYEINLFLKENDVEGEIEDVYILYLVGS